ncbi:predicted protein [Arabidopsis lyrata subsp. lyrata]|uniref:Predicted protein n=2 Tax=Arabidopsis lyrata subsp. lyrata TaxID=81972 RepID=D7KDR9_ARALL|nr:predicted protein [Arabidopsis lyrata subsp. lyrata]
MVIKEVLLYITMLKLEIEALQREYEDLKIIKKEPLHQFQVVKVEKIGEMFQVKIKSPKGENNIVNILEAFEEMGLSVAQARVSCLDSFAMEAIASPQWKDKLCSVDDFTQTLLKAVVKSSAPM